MVNPETRSELAIPMIFKGKVIGVLDLESPQLHYFTEEHVQTLTILAANLAVSLENARLYEQVARDEARMERDLQAAKRIQGALLRPVPTDDEGMDVAASYLPAREVCGDLYDFLRYGPQQLGIALGDVSGKGTAAALYGAVSIGIMRSLAPQKLQPAEMLRQMNQLVGERRIEGRFMTACFATWQKGRSKLRVANAGQSRPRNKLTFVEPATFTPHFSWEKSGSGSDAGESVRCESVSLSEIAEKAGTPTYVYSQAAIGDAYKELVAGFGSLSHTLCFAVKSNGNLAILKYLAGLGSGFDIVSGGELEHLQRIGVPGRRIVFSGVGKKREEMREALRYRPVGSRGARGILLFNI